MSLKNSNNGYGSVAKLFHWLMFLLLLGAIIGGNVESAMADGQEKYEMILLHKSFGSLILFLLFGKSERDLPVKTIRFICGESSVTYNTCVIRILGPIFSPPNGVG